MKVSVEVFEELFVMEQRFIVSDGKKILASNDHKSYELPRWIAESEVNEAYVDDNVVIIHI